MAKTLPRLAPRLRTCRSPSGRPGAPIAPTWALRPATRAYLVVHLLRKRSSVSALRCSGSLRRGPKLSAFSSDDGEKTFSDLSVMVADRVVLPMPAEKRGNDVDSSPFHQARAEHADRPVPSTAMLWARAEIVSTDVEQLPPGAVLL